MIEELVNSISDPAWTFQDVLCHVVAHKWKPNGLRLLGGLSAVSSSLSWAYGINYSLLVDTYYAVESDTRAAADDESISPKLRWHLDAFAPGERFCGKVMVAEKPSGITLATLHYLLNKYLDMDRVFDMLIQDQHSTAYLDGPLSPDTRAQGSYYFSFRYHTIIGADRQPEAWQRSILAEQIPLSECSSVVALSLEGQSEQTVCQSWAHKGETARTYDPFAPWRVLLIQFHPSDPTTQILIGMDEECVNGPHAFLLTVLAEYRDAAKRFSFLQEALVSLVSPVGTGLFDDENVEDYHKLFSKAHFGTYRILAVLCDDIERLIGQYRQNLTKPVWLGTDEILWPRDRSASRHADLDQPMLKLELQFELVIKELQGALEAMRRQQQSIYQMMAIIETRETTKQASVTVEQGRNIRLLTLVSIFFLPLTFVTSVFGMT